MEKIELSPAEVMSALNWNKSKVYYWISSKKFETVERIDGQKVVLTQSDIQRLKKSDDSKSFESFNSSENGLNNSEKVQENSDVNVTKNYENISNNFKQNNVELFNDTLELVKQMHQSSLMNYNYTVKMLSDGQTALEKEHLELKAEYKSVQEKLKVSEKEHQESLKKSETEYQEKIKKAETRNNVKNNIIIAMATLLFMMIVLLVLISTNLIKFETVQENSEEIVVEQSAIEATEQPAEIVPPQPVVKPKVSKKKTAATR